MPQPRILVIFATAHGQTARIAKRILQRLEERGAGGEAYWSEHLQVEATLRDYDGVIVGSSVHVARHHASAVEFVRAHRPFLEELPGAFYSVSASAASEDPEGRRESEDLVGHFLRRTGWSPQFRRSFAGGLPYPQYGRLERLVMRGIAALAGADTDPSRSWEYTDWDRVDAFADDIYEYVLDNLEGEAQLGNGRGMRAAE